MLLKNFIIIIMLNVIINFSTYAETTCNTVKKTVLLTQIIEHPALTAVRLGVKRALADYKLKQGGLFDYDEKNAQGRIDVATSIAQKFVGENPSVIVAISTPSAQTVVSAARSKKIPVMAAEEDRKIPIVFAAVTDPLAAKLIDTLDQPNASVTGVLDRAPFEKQLHLIKHLLGHKKRLGFIYNVGEVNSLVALNIFNDQAETLGLKIIAVSASSSSEVGMVTHGIIDRVDAIYVPNDNTVVSGIDSIIKICSDVRKPVFAADIMLVGRGVIATVGVDYDHIGYLTGEMAVKILQGTPVNQIPVITPQDHVLYVNETQAHKIGFDIPTDIIEKAKEVF